MQNRSKVEILSEKIKDCRNKAEKTINAIQNFPLEYKKLKSDSKNDQGIIKNSFILLENTLAVIGENQNDMKELSALGNAILELLDEYKSELLDEYKKEGYSDRSKTLVEQFELFRNLAMDYGMLVTQVDMASSLTKKTLGLWTDGVIDIKKIMQDTQEEIQARYLKEGTPTPVASIADGLPSLQGNLSVMFAKPILPSKKSEAELSKGYSPK